MLHGPKGVETFGAKPSLVGVGEVTDPYWLVFPTITVSQTPCQQLLRHLRNRMSPLQSLLMSGIVARAYIGMMSESPCVMHSW